MRPEENTARKRSRTSLDPSQRLAQRLSKVACMQLPPSGMEFSELNDYCIDEICEWLPLSSLASLALTNTRMHHICNGYFRRKHSANYIVFSSSNDGNVCLSPDQPYVYCFREQFQTIMIYGADLNLFRLIATKFKEKRIKKICFFAADNLSAEHAICIADILNRAEIIEFIRCSTVNGLGDFLKNCSNMKCLMLKSFTEFKNINATTDQAKITSDHKNHWLLQPYKKLQHFHWDPLTHIPSQLSAFFMQNPNLKSIYATEHFLSYAQRHSIQLNVLILKVIEHSIESRIETFEQLHEMSVEKVIQTVYFIDFHQIVPHVFRSLDNVNGLSTNCTNVHDIVEMFPNLKLISVPIRSLRQAKEMAQHLVHLEEAFIDVFHIDYIVPFIRFTSKLKTIFINNTDSIKALPSLNLSTLIKQRKKLMNSENVTIYLKEEAYLKTKCDSMRTNSALVQIKLIDSYATSNAFVNTILYQ